MWCQCVTGLLGTFLRLQSALLPSREEDAVSAVVPKSLADTEREIRSFLLAAPLAGIPGS